MRLSWLSTPRNPPASSDPASDQPAAVNQPAHARLRRVSWFVALWCLGVAGAMLLALPFRLLMQAAMR
jgi:hypothetical protein